MATQFDVNDRDENPSSDTVSLPEKAQEDTSVVQPGPHSPGPLPKGSSLPGKAAGSDAKQSTCGPNAADPWRGYKIPKKPRTQVVGLDSGSENEDGDDSNEDSDENHSVYSESEAYEDDLYSSGPAQQTTGIPKMADVTARTSRSRESSNERGIPQAGSSSELRDGDFEMFDPLREAKPHTEFLTTAQVNFISKFFSEVVPDETIDSTILENCPIPDLHALVLKKLDTDILDLIPAQAQKAVRQQDGWYITIGKRIKYSLGPLFQLWKVLSNARQSVQDQQSGNSNSDVDVNKVLRLVEQTVVCLGQASQSVDLYRRQAILSRFVRNPKKCKDILVSNDQLLKKEPKELFGSDFYSALSRRAKGSKRLREAKQELAGPPPKRRRLQQHPPPPQQQQPFQHQTPRGGQRGGRQSFRGKGPNRGKGSSAPQGRPGPKRYVSSMSSLGYKRKYRGNSKGYRFYGKSWFNRDQRAGTNRGENSPLFIKLGNCHKRPFRSRHCERPENRLPSGTSTKEGIQSHFFKGSETANNNGSVKNAGKESSTNCGSFPGSVCESYFPSSQEKWGCSSSHKSKETQSINQVRTLQNGGNSFSCGHFDIPGLHGQTRSEGRLLQRSSEQMQSQIPLFPLGKHNVSVQSCPIRASSSPTSLHKITETSNGPPEEIRHQMRDLPRRSDHAKSRQTNIDNSVRISNVATAESGVRDKLGKISDQSVQADRISRFHCGFSGHETVSSREESSRHSSTMSKSAKDGENFSATPSQSNWETDGHNKGHSASPPAIQASAASQISGPSSEQPELRGCSGPVSGMQTGIVMVGGVNHNLERPVSTETQSRPGNKYHHGCIPDGLGSTLQRCEDTGLVDRRGEEATHQCTRNESSDVRCPIICQGPAEDTCPSQSGQHNNGSICEQDGRYKISDHVKYQQTTLGFLPSKGDHNYCRTPAGLLKSNSGRSIETVQRHKQLDVGNPDISSLNKSSGTSGDRSVRGSHEQTTGQICQLETRPRSMENRCFLNQMDRPEGVRLPSILSSGPLSVENPARQSNNSADNTSMAHSAMVHNNTRDANGRPSIDSNSSKLTDLPSEPSTSANGSRSFASSVESHRGSAGKPQISSKAKHLVNNARRPSSQAAYEPAWKRWTRWCDNESVDPFQAPVECIADFLAEIFHSVPLEYSTLNVYRSALSAYHPPIQGFKVGQHPLIKDLLRGAFNTRPPQPKYADTWEVNAVLQAIIDMGENEDLPLNQLSHKLAMLMALVSASRCQEIASLDIQLMNDFGDKVTFDIAELTKSKRPSKPHQRITFMAYTGSENLDVVQCLRVYLRRTQTLRQPGSQKSQLFIGCVKPHKPVAPCTVARWLKVVMSKAGIDIERFKAHSVRGASTSKASKLGLSTQQIIERANWSKATTFFRFYHREVATDQFQERVLQLK